MFIDQIIASGTVIEIATGTKEILMTYQVPALHLFVVIGIAGLSLAVFYLFFKAIWSD